MCGDGWAQVDLDDIEDPTQRASLEAQITYFGQTPSQLFTVCDTAFNVQMLSLPGCFCIAVLCRVPGPGYYFMLFGCDVV